MRILYPGQKSESSVTSPIPFGLQKYLYPLGTPEFSRDDHGAYLTQKIEAADFILHFFRFDIIEPVTLYPVVEKPIIGLNLMLAGSIPAQLPGYGLRLLEENISEMFYVPAAESEIHLKKGIYESCFLEVSPSLITSLANDHPAIQLLCIKLSEQNPKCQPSIPVRMNGEYRSILNDMRTDHQVEPGQRDILFRAGVIKLLSAYKSGISRLEHITSMALSGLERKLLEIEQYIISNANIHDCSQKELSAMFHLPEHTLKTSFKKRFGIPLFHFVLNQCMERARYLLLHNQQSVSDIALELGYSNPYNFSNSFKKHFGCSPLQMKNDHQQPKKT